MTITTMALDPHQVLCDSCGEDWSDRTESGGILFGSKAYCPDCVPKLEQGIAEYGEERFINGRCPKGVAYADWVRDLRGPAPAVTVYSGSDFKKAFDRTNPIDYSED